MYDLRSISYLIELVHPPMQHDLQKLQEFYNELSKPPLTLYQNFNVAPGGAQISNAAIGAGAASTLTITGDRIQILEQRTPVDPEEFARRAVQIVELAQRHLNYQVFMPIQYVVRTLINPHTTHDTRRLVGRQMCNLSADTLESIGREPNLFGIRLVFPQDDTSNSIFNVRVESYNTDHRSLFIENAGIFPTPLPAGEPERLAEGFNATYTFIRDNLARMVRNFDQ
ncbi:MAG: hypothetical protein RL885_13760 [Planctomycetota bacterium]